MAERTIIVRITDDELAMVDGQAVDDVWTMIDTVVPYMLGADNVVINRNWAVSK